MFADTRYGARQLLKKPGFTAVALLSLSLGIASASVMYSVIYAAILNPFPYRDVDTLAGVGVIEPGRTVPRTYHTADQLLEIAEKSSIFSRVSASSLPLDVVWTGRNGPQRLAGSYVTPETFPMLGVQPLVGRAITASDAAPGAPAVCVLSYKFWQSHFGGDRGVIGSQLQLDGTIWTVAGVMPPRFTWQRADVYLPMILKRGLFKPGGIRMLGRVKAGVTAEHAESELRAILEEWQRSAGPGTPGRFRTNQWRVGLRPFRESFRARIRETLWILLGAVGLLLLIACGNISILLFANAADREREIAIRAAIGAGRLRLIRQLLTESLLLALLGGVLGIALAWAGLRAVVALLAMAPRGMIPEEAVIELNVPVLLFTLGVSVLTALISGLAPALAACKRDVAGALAGSSRGATAGVRQRWLVNGAVVLQVALSVVLLAGASLMFRALLARQQVDFGIRTDNVMTTRVPLDPLKYRDSSKRAAFFHQVLERVRNVPGVIACGVSRAVHPAANISLPIGVVGSSQQQSPEGAMIQHVNTGYFRVFGITLVKGRLFTESEMVRKQHFALINQEFVRRYLSDGEPIGRLVTIPRLLKAPFNIPEEPFQVVGVVSDTYLFGHPNGAAELYMPFTITAQADSITIRGNSDPGRLIKLVVGQVHSVDAEQPVLEFRTIDSLISDSFLSTTRFNLLLLAAFAILGLILAVIGVYGAMSQAVSRRTKEIGIRIAMGASFASIAGIVGMMGFRLLSAGIALGVAGGLLASQMIKGLIWNVSPTDPLSFTLVSVVLLASGLLACVRPAWRAARTDPTVTLRGE